MSNDIIALGPFIAAVAVAIAVLIVDIAVPGRRTPVLVVSLGGLAIVAALILTTGQAVVGGNGTLRVEAFGGAYVVDGLTTFLDLLFVGIVAFTIVFAPDYLEARGLPLAEFAMVLLFAMTGAMLISGFRGPAGPVRGPRAHGPARLHARGLPQDRRLLHRGRDQVLPPRLVQLGDLPVRARVHVGRDRHDEHRRRARRAHGRGRQRRGASRLRSSSGWAS